MELDITTLENTYLFLQELETQGFVSYKLVFKVVSRINRKITFFNFENLQDFYNRYSILLTNTSPNRYCIVGDFVYLENIKFINNAVPYENNIFYYNITSGNPQIKKDLRYNNNKNAFFEQDVKKFVAYLKESLIAYINRNDMLMETRQSAYVDPCYVDPGYVSDDPNVIIDDENSDLE